MPPKPAGKTPSSKGAVAGGRGTGPAAARQVKTIAAVFTHNIKPDALYVEGTWPARKILASMTNDLAHTNRWSDSIFN